MWSQYGEGESEMAGEAEGKPEGEKRDEAVNYEELAKKEGWRSKDELGEEFDPARYVGAEEFIKRKPLFDTIKQQGKKIKELVKTVDSVVSFSQKNAELAAKRAIADLTAQKKEAVKLGDSDAVEAIDKNIDAQKEVIAEAVKVQRPDAIPSEIIDWTDKNPWFNEDIEMQDFATAYCASWAKRNPKEGMEKALDETTKAVKKAFPDNKYFKTRRQDAAVVEGHRSDGADPDTTSNKKYTVSRLTEDQRICFNAYKKNGMTIEQYSKKLEEIGDLR
jgi:hypothetical protein